MNTMPFDIFREDTTYITFIENDFYVFFFFDVFYRWCDLLLLSHTRTFESENLWEIVVFDEKEFMSFKYLRSQCFESQCLINTRYLKFSVTKITCHSWRIDWNDIISGRVLCKLRHFLKILWMFAEITDRELQANIYIHMYVCMYVCIFLSEGSSKCRTGTTNVSMVFNKIKASANIAAIILSLLDLLFRSHNTFHLSENLLCYILCNGIDSPWLLE